MKRIFQRKESKPTDDAKKPKAGNKIILQLKRKEAAFKATPF
jgi:hypothetical protein